GDDARRPAGGQEDRAAAHRCGTEQARGCPGGRGAVPTRGPHAARDAYRTAAHERGPVEAGARGPRRGGGLPRRRVEGGAADGESAPDLSGTEPGAGVAAQAEQPEGVRVGEAGGNRPVGGRQQPFADSRLYAVMVKGLHAWTLPPRR